MLVYVAPVVAVTVLALEALSPARGVVALSAQVGRWEVAGVLGTSYSSRKPLIRMKQIWDQQSHCDPWRKVGGSVTVRTSGSGCCCRLASHLTYVSLHEPQHEQARSEEHDKYPQPSLARKITRTVMPKASSSSEASTAVSLRVPRDADRATAAVALQESSTLELRPERSISPFRSSQMATTAVDWSVERQHLGQQQQENQNQNQNNSPAVVGDGNLSKERRRMPSLPNTKVQSAITVNTGTNRTDIRSSNNVNKRRDNQVRMFFLEKGLSPEEVRKVLPVTRRDSRLMSDMGLLAAKMQVRTASVEAREGRVGETGGGREGEKQEEGYFRGSVCHSRETWVFDRYYSGRGAYVEKCRLLAKKKSPGRPAGVHRMCYSKTSQRDWTTG